MALLNAQQVGIVDAAPTYQAAAAGGDAAYPDDRAFFHVKTGATAITATLVIPGQAYGQNRPDVAFAVPANSERFIGPITPDMADPTDGQVDLTYSAVTNVTVALRRI